MAKIRDKVSVIIPTYNRSVLLKKAIISLQNQTYRNMEIIIVDDCSNDDTAEVIRNMKDERIRYIKHETNKGGSEARNTGIRHASGAYIGFLDSDDQWLPDKLEKQLAVFEGNPKAGVVYTGVKVVSETHLIKEIIPQCKGNILPKLIEFNCIDTTSSIVVKKELLQEVNGFDSSLPSCQDWDLYIRLSKIAQFDYVKDSLVLFYQHSGERITSNNKSVVNGQMLIYRKYRELAREQETEVFQKFIINIFKTLLKIGIINQNKDIVKLSRRMLYEGLEGKRSNIKFVLYYFSTYMNLKFLLLLFQNSKKPQQKQYRKLEVLSS